MAESYTIEDRIGSYELSLWTHTNTYLRLLKGKVDFEGQAYNVIFTKKIDGGDELTFSIPLYVYNYDTGAMVENPAWSLIYGEQKIRLIRNRGESTESVSDFVLKVFSEGREDDIAIMNITGQSYALYELNKIGLAITMSEDLTVGLCKSDTPPTLVDKNTIWIDYSNVFRIYTGDSEDDPTDMDNWTLVYDVYLNGLPELLQNSQIKPKIMRASTSTKVPVITTLRSKVISGKISGCRATMSLIKSVEGSKIATITTTTGSGSSNILNPIIVTP